MRTLIFLSAVAMVAGGVEPAPNPKVHTITIADMRFTPQTITIARGDVVVWVNKDLVDHTATSSDRVFDSNTIKPDASWRFVPRKAGSFEYTCTLHPTMIGTLRVR